MNRLLRALGYSMSGLKQAFRHEAAFRQEIALALVLIPLALWLGRDGPARALLVGSVLLVLVIELLNSAIEAVVDRISGDHHELAGRAKDMGSAAVLLSIASGVCTWFLVLAT